jgi:SAM-dependent methyltransferase
VGTREYFDQVEQRKYFVEPHIPRYAEFPRWSGKKVLEIGCGIGTDTVNFLRHGAFVTAVDLSERSVALARRRAELYGFADRARFLVRNSEELTGFLPAEPYDLVYAFGAIHHSPHPDRILEQVRSYVRPACAVRPGITVKVMVYHRHSWKAFGILLRHGLGRPWKWSELIARHSEAETGCPVTYSYTRGEARALLEGHGLRVSQLQVEHIFPYRIPDYVQYRYRKAWYFRRMPEAMFRSMERQWGWHLCLTAEAI